MTTVAAGAIPQAAFVASLAGFERMTANRLSGLLASRSAEHAFAVATGGCRPPEPFATLFAREPDLVRVSIIEARLLTG